ncbi:IS66 family insertion sequence element accessory protein TnpB [Pseudomonas sp. LD120]|uniref:IS66 family insertion sequence element accessory protein TnpB n=1 Tax=Pseudomonas sp. LD120 TaxID=485751 RepID=UPI0013591C29|nr:IS66 family insertion sequence element accessory protein TnpB [Pseudomonas sp. LD120]KAF0865460.1 hypothetical protein PLD_09290 [Pseudomonas sp. LD120]
MWSSWSAYKRLESERFKTSPDDTNEAIVLTAQELNWLLDGFDLWRNRPHQVCMRSINPTFKVPSL